MQLKSTHEQVTRIGTRTLGSGDDALEYAIVLRPFQPDQGKRSRHVAEIMVVHPSKLIFSEE